MFHETVGITQLLTEQCRSSAIIRLLSNHEDPAMPEFVADPHSTQAPGQAESVQDASSPGGSIPSSTASHGWPAVCTLAELGRILTLIHGVRAPADSSLKKWSAAGVFRSCMATQEDIDASEAPSSLTHEVLQRPRRGGRPGLRLRTAAAIGRVYELWPFLADSDSHAILELAVARTADHFRAALGPAGPSLALPAAASELPAAVSGPALQEVQEQLTALMREMAAVRRELAQFSALRNNLITKLDDVVARAKDAFGGGAQTSAAGFDPLAEARRDRDMGLMKSTLSEILATLERIESGRG
ncbi:hypothetical protein [Variovorax sp. J31P207]|uniref:hypothetical protein n=1 Tax=Variovorax sp. J31P207 TaxID=3053510 RepID=UPI002578A475|nr:hypothetical protein [Variovorax sp. J31P207]MDM0066479.1 hypothetical protein [Variovorax sp. J31P207]